MQFSSHAILDSDRSDGCIDFKIMLFFPVIIFSGRRRGPIGKCDTLKKFENSTLIVLY